MIRVLSYNVFLGKKLGDILAWLASFYKNYDVICLQEYPKSKQFQLSRHFDVQYKYIFSHGFTKKKESYGQITLYNSSRLTSSSPTVVSLGSVSVENVIHGNKGQRTALITELKNNEGRLLLVNTHLACLAINRVRRRQLQLIVDKLHAIYSHKTLAKIILGDFNYTSLLRQHSLVKFMTKNNFINAYKKHTHKLLFLKHQLDYAFYNNCAIRNVEVEKIHFSDHYPVRFEVHF
jgi:endonuclease/exonuclease/phosphatase family metal-dependent hydrolase